MRNKLTREDVYQALVELTEQNRLFVEKFVVVAQQVNVSVPPTVLDSHADHPLNIWHQLNNWKRRAPTEKQLEQIRIHLRRLAKEGRVIRIKGRKALYRLPETPSEIAKLRLSNEG